MKQMHLGLGTYTFPWNIMLSGSLSLHSFTFRDMLGFTADNNIRFFQFCDNYPLHLLTKNERSALKKLAVEKNIQLQVGTRGLRFDHIIQYISIASSLNAAFLRVVIDDENYHPAEKDIIEIIRALLPSLKKAGIALAIENHDRFKAKTLAAIINQTDAASVAICLDTANSLGAGEGAGEIIPVLLPYTVNLHIKDFTIARGRHKMGFTVSGAAAGKGMLDIPRLLNECSQYERCSTATLEIWMDEEKTPEKTILKEMRQVKESIKYLKKYIS
ncbi:MAG: TIM barrel protein [Agriterribacter sp.]